MSDFVDDYTDVPETKVDATAIPSGAPTARYVRAADINTLSGAAASLRTSQLGGKVHGLRTVSSAPSQRSGVAQTYFLNNKLMLDNGTGTTGRPIAGSVFFVEDYGSVDPTGVADSTAAILATILAAQATGIAYATVIQLPQGTFTITDTLLVAEAYGMVLRGHGIGATRLYVSSAVAGKPIILLRNCSFCRVEDMSINGLTGSLPSVGIEIRNESGHSTGLSTKNTVRDVVLGSSGRLMRKGISMSGNVDGNNDFHTFERVEVYGSTVADFAIDNTQSVGHELISCNFNGLEGSCTYGIQTGATRDRAADDTALGGASAHKGGKFHWLGGSNGGHSAADVYIGGEGPGVNVVDVCNSEGSYRFLDSAGTPGISNGIAMRGIRFAAEAAFAGDGIAFKWGYGGFFELTRSRFDTSAAKISYVRLNASAPLEYNISGNQWNQAGSESVGTIVKTYNAPSGAYPGGQYIGIESNLYMDASDVAHWKGNTSEGVRYSDTELTVVEEGGGRLVLDCPYTLLTPTAGLTRTLKAFSIRAGYKLTTAVLKVSTSFAGTATLTASLGTGGSPTNVLLAANMKAAGSTFYGLVDGDKGAAFTRAACESGGYMPSFAADTQINLAFTSTVNNLSLLSAGSARLYVTLAKVGE